MTETARIRLEAEDAASPTIRSVAASLTALVGSAAALAGVSFGFGAGLTNGLKFNSMLEDSATGMAAVIAANQRLVDSNGAVVSGTRALEYALAQAGRAQQALKKDALETSFSFAELVTTFQSAVGPGLAAGIQGLDRVREVAVAAAKAMQALQIPAYQGAQEIRALFSGEQGPDNRLNQVLRITKAEIDAVKKSGADLAQFYLDKLQPYTDAAAASTKNLSVMVSNLGDAIDQSLGQATKPIFDALKGAAGGLNIGAAQEGLNEIGRDVAGLVREFAPLLQSVGMLVVAIAKAGAAFLSSFGPIAPALKVIIDFAALIIDKFGEWIIVIWLAQKAYLALAAAAALSNAASAAAGAKAAVVALWASVVATYQAVLGLSAAMATAAAGGVAAALAVAAAWAAVGLVIAGVVYAAILAKEAWDANKAAQASAAALTDTTAMAMDRLVAKFPEAKTEVEALRVKMAQATSPEAVMALNKEFTALQRTYVTLGNTVKETPVVPPIDPKIADDMAAMTLKLKQSIELLGTPDALKPMVAARQAGEALIAQIKKDFPEGAAKAALLGLAAQEMGKKIAEATQKYNAEAAIKAFDEIEQAMASRDASQKAFNETLEEQAKAAARVTDEVGQEIEAFELIEAEQLKIVEGQRLWNDELDRLGATGFASVRKMREAYQDAAAAILDNPNSSAAQGITAGMLQVFADIPTAAQSAATAVRSIWGGMARAFDDLFFNVLTGRLDSLKDVLKGFADTILKSVSNYLSDLLQRYISTLMQAQGKSALPMSKTYGADGSVIGGGGSSGGGLDGVLGGAAVGLGVGSVVGQFGNDAGYGSTGALAGGVIGGILATTVLNAVVAGMISTITSGVITGAAAGTAAGPVGALIGAIVGLAIGILATPNTEVRVPFQGDRLNSSQRNLTRGVAGNIGGFISDLAKAGGFDSDARGAMAGAANDIMTWFFKNMNFSAYAGSREDLDKDIALLFTDVIPRELLHQMFGNRANSELGNPGYAGITGATRYDDSVNYGAPITKMLLELGVSVEKVRDLSRMIDSTDPKKFMEFLSAFVEVVAGFKDLQDKFSMNADELVGEIRRDSSKTALDALKERVGDIKDIFNAISLYSESEQVEKGKEALNIAREFFSQVKAYAAQLIQAGDAFAASVAGQLARMRDMFKNREWIADDLRRGITDIMFGSYETGSGSMIGVSPEKGMALAQQAQQYIQQLFDILAQRLADIAGLSRDIEGLRARFGMSRADREFEAAGGNQSLGVAGLANMAAAIQRKIAEAQTLTGDAQLNKIAEIRDAAGEMYDYHLQLLRSIREGILDITRSIDEQIRGIKWDAVTRSYEEAVRKMNEATDPAEAARYKAEAESIRAGQVDELQAQYEALMAQIATSSDPEEIRRLTTQAQGIIRQYLGLFSGPEVDPATRAAAEAEAERLLIELRARSVASLEALGDAVEDLIDDMVPGLNTVGAALTTQMNAVKAEMELLAARLLLLNERVQRFVDMGVTNATNQMNLLAPVIAAARTTFTEFSGEVAGGTTSVDDFGDAVDTAGGKVDRFGRSLDRVAGLLDGLFTGGGAGSGPPNTGPTGGGTNGGASGNLLGETLALIRREPSLMRSYT